MKIILWDKDQNKVEAVTLQTLLLPIGSYVKVGDKIYSVSSYTATLTPLEDLLLTETLFDADHGVVVEVHCDEVR